MIGLRAQACVLDGGMQLDEEAGGLALQHILACSELRQVFVFLGSSLCLTGWVFVSLFL